MSNKMTFVIMLFWRLFFKDNLFVCFLYCYKQYKPVTVHLNLFIFYFLDGFSKVCSLNKNKIIKMQNKKKM